jgi:hypothetical protein
MTDRLNQQGVNIESKDEGRSISVKKLEANRRNARLSTGPRTEAGKNHSRRNAVRHGVLASALLIREGDGAEDAGEFAKLLRELRDDLQPVGAVEEMLVEKIAVCWWRQQRALRCEAELVRRASVHEERSDLEKSLDSIGGGEWNAERETIQDHLSLPLGLDLDRILRYETTIAHQLTHAINQLERLQRARKGEHVPAPVSVQLSND